MIRLPKLALVLKQDTKVLYDVLVEDPESPNPKVHIVTTGAVWSVLDLKHINTKVIDPTHTCLNVQELRARVTRVQKLFLAE